MLLHQFERWSPFQIDALGIITLIGAEEVDRAVGRLTHSYLTDWLPLLGVYKVSGNAFKERIPGFVLYNITDGILAPDLTGWFARWVLCQNISFSSTTIYISVIQHPRSSYSVAAATIGFLSLALPIILSILVGDWWGFANAMSMASSVVVRRIILEANESALDKILEGDGQLPDEMVKVFVTTPSGDAVTVFTSRRVVLDCLLTTPHPQKPTLYRLTRAVGWLAFGTQTIALGMSSLLIQMVSVLIICISTVMVVAQVGSNEMRVGTRLKLLRKDANVSEGLRPAAYARLRLTKEEEDSMVAWNLFPHRTNVDWWQRYRARVRALESCDEKLEEIFNISRE
ncbi:hypothetical protein EYC84_001384 [Monilinia fructicola]|uniref:Uncharacterized protein n=1 Tax=Monilinia fructicola TaxID=38448 RepID=A0A5M9JQ68_MONFR|nr:hypothetical protein EYC84_001384 [Monilinia fructicola]